MGWIQAFIRGMASMVDFGGTIEYESPFRCDSTTDYEGFQADNRALEGDWIKIGDDMTRAMDSTATNVSLRERLNLEAKLRAEGR